MRTPQTAEPRSIVRVAGILLALLMVATACGGDDGDGGSTEGTIEGETIVVPQEQLEEALAARDGETDEDEPEPLSSENTDVTGQDASDDDGDGGTGDEAEIEVAEAEEDELDGLLNAVTMFNSCLGDEGFEFMGAPGQDGAAADEFEGDYLAALGKCATESDILAAFQAFGDAQANLTPEEIEETNFGLPVFKECMEDLGWEVAELVPDERGALGFGGPGAGTGLTPPEGTDALDLEDVSTCRLAAEQHVADNFEAASGE